MRSPFRKALVISLLNPKAILFFISFFIQFVDPGYALAGAVVPDPGRDLPGVQRALPVRADLRRDLPGRPVPGAPQAGGRATTGVGALFLGFGAKLATATLS